MLLHTLSVLRWENISKFGDTTKFKIWKENQTKPQLPSSWYFLETIAVEILPPRGLVLSTQISLLYCRIKNNGSIAQTDLVRKSGSATVAGGFGGFFVCSFVFWESSLSETILSY